MPAPLPWSCVQDHRPARRASAARTLREARRPRPIGLIRSRCGSSNLDQGAALGPSPCGDAEFSFVGVVLTLAAANSEAIVPQHDVSLTQRICGSFLMAWPLSVPFTPSQVADRSSDTFAPLLADHPTYAPPYRDAACNALFRTSASRTAALPSWARTTGNAFA